MRSQFNSSPNQGATIADGSNDLVVCFKKFFTGLGNQGVVVRNDDSWKISPDHNWYSYQSINRGHGRDAWRNNLRLTCRPHRL
jgi:hypothetical protein